MAVSIIEHATGTASTTATPTATLSTTPTAGDVIVAVLVGGQNSSTFTSATGCGATWASGYVPAGGSAGQRMFIIGTGATTSGTVTLTVSAARNCFVHLYLIRGLSSTTVTGVDSSTSSATAFVGTSQSAGVGQIVIGAARGNMTTAGLMSIASSTSLPSSGAWTGRAIITNSFLGSGSTATSIPGSTDTYALAAATSGAAGAFNISQIVLGSASTPVALTGVTANITVAALAGTVSTVTTAAVALTGVTADVQVAAPAGSVVAGTKIPVSLTGVTVDVAVSALAGTAVAGSAVPVALTGITVDVALAAPAGSVVAGTKIPAALTGVTANVAVSALAGDVTTVSAGPIVLTGVTADVDITAHAGVVSLVSTPLALDFAASLDFGLTLSPATGLALDFGGSVDFDLTLSRTHTIDPSSQLPQYRLIAVQADGTVLGEVPDAQIGDIVDELGLDGTRLDFSVPKYDETNALVRPTRGQPIPEVQVWRGPNLETWQKVDGARPNDATIDYDASGLAGHLDGRVMGKTPKTDWLINGQFHSALLGWSFGYDAGSIPPTAPKHSVVDVDFFGVTAKALKLSGSDTITTVTQTLETAAVFVPNSASFLPGGAALITSEANQIPAGTAAILIEGHTAYNYLDHDYGDGVALSLARANAAKPYVQAVHPTASITTVGRGRFRPLNDNSTYAEQAKNRRVEFHYTKTVTADADAAQWAKGSLTPGATVTNTTGRPMPVTFKGWALLTNYLSTSKTGYGVYLTLAKASDPTVIIEDASSTLDDKTPTDDWTRHDATVTIPADGVAYILTVKFYAPGGDVLWTYGGVFPEEALFFPSGTDRALVVKGLVEHGQDPAMGKLGDWPILIGTKTPLTGRKTKAEYPFHERRKILDAVNEHAAVAHGVDLRLGHSDTERWIETHYPRLGAVSGVTLELGSNVIAYDAPTDLVASATRSIVQALESSGADREEGIFTDLSGLGGTLVERLDYAEPGTPVTELAGAAESSTIRRGGPIVALTVTIGKVGAPDPDLTSWMLDHVKVGDVVQVDIQDGPSVFVGPFRVVRKVLTPETDTLRYSLSPEV